MVDGAHFDLAGVARELHAFQLVGNLYRIGRPGALDRFREHVHLRVHAQVIERQVLGRAAVFLVPLVGEFFGLVRHDVAVPLGDLLHLAFTRVADRRQRAEAAAVVGIERRGEAGVLGRLDQQRHVVAPVAGDDGVGVGLLHLRDVRSEILHLRERVQVVAHDLDVRALSCKVFLRRARHGLAERVVLVDQVHVLDLGVLGHVGGQRLHLHVAVGIPAEVPEAALGVVEIRIHRGVVEVHDGLARIAFVVLVHGVDQGAGNGGAVALGDEADTAVDHLLEHVQAFLGAQFVVEGHYFELHAARKPALIYVLDHELELFQSRLADVGHAAGQWVDVGNLDGLGLGRERNDGRDGCERCRADDALDHVGSSMREGKCYRRMQSRSRLALAIGATPR